ncbi:MAG TPA: LapA family protein [Solirubrobacteraceae bacterium]|nr:LapA family protein [Solirubrobacteraceae bacterium]
MSVQAPGPERPRRGTRETARTAVLVILAALITAFAVQNTGSVRVKWILGSGEAPLIVVIVISLLVGALITYLAMLRSGRRR